MVWMVWIMMTVMTYYYLQTNGPSRPSVGYTVLSYKYLLHQPDEYEGKNQRYYIVYVGNTDTDTRPTNDSFYFVHKK